MNKGACRSTILLSVASVVFSAGLSANDTRSVAKKENAVFEYTQQQLKARELVMQGRTPMVVTFSIGFDKGLPDRMRDAGYTADLLKTLGVNTIQYLSKPGQFFESEKNTYDWNKEKRDIRILKKTGLGQAVFLKVGAAFTMSERYMNSEKNYPYVCLEHNQATPIQSLWGPYIKETVDNAIEYFARLYKDEEVITMFLAGITGDYGESLYPASPVWRDQYHVHSGYWCGDEEARKDFSRFLENKYGSLQNLGAAWRKGFTDFSKIDPVLPGDVPSRRAWLDQLEWYRRSMTDFTEFWLSTIRKYFPSRPLYIVAGGSDDPRLGTDLSAQIKMAKKYNAGIRLTNENSEYASNFPITRLVASAARFYGVYFGYEPAGDLTREGVVSRIFGDVAAGADEIYFYDWNVITPRDTRQPETAEAFFNYSMYLTKAEPLIDIAVFFPRVHFTLEPERVFKFYSNSGFVRDYFDHDYVDELMVLDGALSKYSILMMLEGYITEQAVWDKVLEWVDGGGVFVTLDLDGVLQTPEGDRKPHRDLVGFEGIPDELKGLEDESEILEKAMHPMGKGCVVFFPYTWKKRAKYLNVLKLVHERFGLYPACDWKKDGVYVTLEKDRMLLHNSSRGRKTKTIKIDEEKFEKAGLVRPAVSEYEVNLSPHSIGCILFSQEKPITMSYEFSGENKKKRRR